MNIPNLIIEIHCGDIIKINTGFIVNASNTSDLGCYIRNHCINNIIYFAINLKLLCIIHLYVRLIIYKK